MNLDPEILARWQFGLTTLYHFIFVPLTLGMGLVVAVFQSIWVRTNNVVWLQLTRLFGKIFLINFAMGVVTGIVQEFQFGMNWSAFSRFVGDVFGAPLAFEGILAFLLEATFLGIWIFGWDRLNRGLHLASLWIAWVGAALSAYIILAANSFMQNPVGFTMNNGRAEMNDFLAVVTNPVVLATFPHVMLASIMVACGVLIGVSAWHMSRNQHVEIMRRSLRFGLWGMVIAFVGVFIAGDQLAMVMVETQPMKMSSAEALYNSACGANASFSLFSLGTPDGSGLIWSIRVPYALSILATNSFDGCVEGINQLSQQYVSQWPDLANQLGDPAVPFAPIIWVTYWSFRWMMGFGFAATLVAIVGLWLTRKKAKRAVPQWAWKVAIWTAPFPVLGSLVGWVFTEMGRQPWVVFSLLLTQDGVSPNVPGWTVLISLVVFTLIYGVLTAVEVALILKAAKKGPEPLPDKVTTPGETKEMTTVY